MRSKRDSREDRSKLYKRFSCFFRVMDHVVVVEVWCRWQSVLAEAVEHYVGVAVVLDCWDVHGASHPVGSVVEMG